MKITNGISNFTTPGRPVALTLGFFDGVHRGHQALVSRLLEVAAQTSAISVVLTFDSHPFRVVRPHMLPPMIMTLAQRLELLAGLGVECAVVLPFDENLAQMPAYAFLDDIILGKLHAGSIVSGYDCHFGRNREGGHEMLRRRAREKGYCFYELPPCEVEGRIVSSTSVRQAIQQGEIDLAKLYLGRPWTINARVTGGYGVGRSMGFPTANLDVGDLILPAHGVYAGYAVVDARTFKAAMYVGNRPTFPGRPAELVCEVYVIGFRGEMHDKWISVQPVKHLRGDRQFDSTEELSRQIAVDVEAANQLLENADEPTISLPRHSE